MIVWYIQSVHCIMKCLKIKKNIFQLYCGKFVTKDFFVTGGSEPHIFRLVDLRGYTVSNRELYYIHPTEEVFIKFFTYIFILFIII